jgi:cell division protein FtsI/penicillin-binding protein 2
VQVNNDRFVRQPALHIAHLLLLVLILCAGPHALAAIPTSDLDRRLARHEAASDHGRVAVVLSDANTQRVRYMYNPDVVLRGTYPIGSLMKPLAAAVLLQTPGFQAGQRIRCDGRFTLTPGMHDRRDDLTFNLQRAGQRHFMSCWKRAGHGAVDLREALIQSCNVYFLTQTARHRSLYAGLRTTWHFTVSTDAAGLGTERPGIAELPESLTPFGRLAATIGEGGSVRLTPIKLAQIYGALFQSTPLLRPFQTTRPRPAARFGRPFRPDILGRLTGILKEVPTRGTLRSMRVPSGDLRVVAAKTGTATHYRKKYSNHGWNVLLLERASQALLLVVFVESGSGGKEARAVTELILPLLEP